MGEFPTHTQTMSLRMLSPRVAILARGFVAYFILPISLVWSSSRVLSILGYHILTWLFILLQVTSLPAFTAALLLHRLWSAHLRAARSGGVLPPRYMGRGFGNLGTLNEFLEVHWKTGYPGILFEHVVAMIVFIAL